MDTLMFTSVHNVSKDSVVPVKGSETHFRDVHSPLFEEISLCQSQFKIETAKHSCAERRRGAHLCLCSLTVKNRGGQSKKC